MLVGFFIIDIESLICTYIIEIKTLKLRYVIYLRPSNLFKNIYLENTKEREETRITSKNDNRVFRIFLFVFSYFLHVLGMYGFSIAKTSNDM